MSLMCSGVAEDHFLGLESFLVESGKMKKDDAKVYVFGLKRGTITSRDVAGMTGLSQSTAKDRLARLADRGFFESTLGEGHGRGRAVRYRALHPRLVLKGVIARTEELQSWLAKIDEHLEYLGESPAQESDFWLTKSHEETLSMVASMIEAAKEEIKLYSHDCSWIRVEEIKEAIKAAISKGVKLEVIATNPLEEATHELDDMGVHLENTQFNGPVFCVIDGSILLMPYKGGALETYYYLMKTNDKHWVTQYLNCFNSIKSSSRPWGE